jgi:transglutaminase-like putative cysteine protease
MIPHRALSVAVYLLVADSLAALFLGGLLSLPAVMLVAAAVVGSLWREPLRQRVERVPSLGVVLVGVASVGMALEIATVIPAMLDAFTHLLVFLVLIKLYTRRTPRDARDIAFLGFFMLVAVSPVTTSVVFLGLFVAFLVLSTWLLMLRHLLSEADNADAPALPARPVAGLGRDLLGLSLTASAATIVVTALLFLIIPRVGQAALPLRAQAGRMVSGFTERVQLGAYGEIETDATVVMRVHLTQYKGSSAAPETLPSLRWRGVAFDHFDGRTWRVSRSTLKVTLRRQLPTLFPVQPHQGGPVLTQEVYLEPIGTEMIFGVPRILRVQGRADHVTLDDLGNIAVLLPAARLQYTVESEPEPVRRRAGAGESPTMSDPRWHARYTQLPAVSPRVLALAREVTAGSADHEDAARRLTAWLSRELIYTRVLETNAGDPIEDFLFVHRSGNCEYFAAALAVMLRSLGIPARVVNGFQRGEWNPYGSYFMVRLRDAHSWVEVYLNETGWTTFDPSPRGVAEPVPEAAKATLWLDALRMSWSRYVVSFSVHDQLAAAESLRRTTVTWSAAGARWPDWRELPRPLLAVLALGLVLAFTVGWRRRRAVPAAGVVAMPDFYARTLRLLARRRLVPDVPETARELAARAAAAGLGAPVATLTSAYERVRFGGAALTPPEAEAVAAALTVLASSPTKETTAMTLPDRQVD